MAEVPPSDRGTPKGGAPAPPAAQPPPSAERREGGQPRAGDGKHVLALVQSGDVRAAIRKLECDEARPCGDVEHTLTRTRADRGNEGPAPAGILAEAEHRA